MPIDGIRKGIHFLPKMVYKRVRGWIWGGDSSYKTLLNTPPPSPAEQWTKTERHNVITSGRWDNAKCNKCYEYATIKKNCRPLKVAENT